MNNDSLNDLVAQWHMAPDNSPAATQTLHEFLGMTWEEYCHWVACPHIRCEVYDTCQLQ